MKGQLLILSGDAVFARMLELEARMMNLAVSVRGSYSDEPADVILCDLDSVLPTPEMAGAGLIGFTRRFELSAVDPERRCAMILHRPFEMRLLREELMSFLDGDGAATRKTVVRMDGSDLICNGSRVALSPTEATVMNALIEHRPSPVSREALSRLIGESAGNKADVYVCYLRRKLAAVSEKPLIRTLRGQGYALITE
ncbi:MAG: winged helix-turn-helix domain-containing protein [Clostridia bacterium]|nr:winged helix-turn-helix domain-containing protein [Clostridia bacterium]